MPPRIENGLRSRAKIHRENQTRAQPKTSSHPLTRRDSGVFRVQISLVILRTRTRNPAVTRFTLVPRVSASREQRRPTIVLDTSVLCAAFERACNLFNFRAQVSFPNDRIV